MLGLSIKTQILSVIAIAVLVCSGSFVIPQDSDSSLPPAVEATGVLG
jgi:hypothetical protein